MLESFDTFIQKKTNLPRPTDFFVGREAELNKVLGALDPSTRAWIVSLTGVGGIGKTEIAVQAAYLAAKRRIFDSVIWTTAKESWLTPEGVQSLVPDFAFVSLDDLLNTVIEVLGLDPRLYRVSAERKSHLVLEALKSTRCLIIVDNLETVQDRAVIQFLTDLPQPSKAIVTTRLGGLSASGAPIAQTLEGQREIRIGPMDEKDAMNLFIRRATDFDFHFSGAEFSDRLQEVVRRAGCIPLALEWIVAQMALKGLPLKDALDQISSPDGEVLQYCFNNLLEAVGERAQKVLLAVPIFVESASSEALTVVTGMNKNSLGDALQRLTAASLVELREDGRYSVLAPTRLYVSTLWRQFPDLYQDYSIKTAQYYDQLIDSIDKRQRWKSVEVEHHNVLSIFSWCFENAHFALVLQLAQTMSQYLQRLGLWDQRAHICELATIAASNLGRDKDAILFNYDAAEIHKHRGRLDQALREFQRCEEYSEDTGDKVTAARARMQIGAILYHKGKYADAIRTLRQSLEMLTAAGDEVNIAMTLSLIGRCELALGNLSEAQKYYEESIGLKKKTGNQLGIAISQYDLGHLYQQLGDLQRAEQSLDEAIKILSELGDKRHQANAKWYYTLLMIDRGQFEIARNCLMEVIEIEEELQREVRADRASAKLAEVEEMIAQGAAKVAAGAVLREDGINATRYFIVIGVENYKHLTSIPGAQKDSQELSSILSKSLEPGEGEVITLIGESATCSAIRRQLKKLSFLSNEEPAIAAIFIGHVIRQGNRNYLCGYETNPDNLDMTAIEGNELAALIRDIPARSRILFLDCQHRLEITQEAAAEEQTKAFSPGFSSVFLDFLASNIKAHILSSTQEGQVSHRFAHMGRRLFTYYMLKGMAGEACLRGDNRVYLLDLYYYIEQSMRESVQDQSPQLYPQPGDSRLVLCSAINRAASRNIKITYEPRATSRELLEAKVDTARNEKLVGIREAIIANPIEGAIQLSGYLQKEDPQLQTQVDLYRSELLGIQADRERYGSVDPSLASQWGRCVFNLLDICRTLDSDEPGEITRQDD